MIYALDTNIISYLMKHYGNVRKRYFDAITDGNRCIIPLVVYYEVMRGLEASGATVQVREFDDFPLTYFLKAKMPVFAMCSQWLRVKLYRPLKIEAESRCGARVKLSLKRRGFHNPNPEPLKLI
jgi:hypothetical protein